MPLMPRYQARFWIPYLTILIPEVQPVFHLIIQSIFNVYGSKHAMREQAECLAKSKLNNIYCSAYSTKSITSLQKAVNFIRLVLFEKSQIHKVSKKSSLYILKNTFLVLSKRSAKFDKKENTNFLQFQITLIKVIVLSTCRLLL